MTAQDERVERYPDRPVPIRDRRIQIMTDGSVFVRPARVEEANFLTELLLRSKAYWGYDTDFMERCRAALAIAPEWIASDTFFVLQTQSQIIGFYSLQRQDTTAELTDLFIEPLAIGKGYGTLLWQHAVQTVRSFGAKTLFIKSDPNAVKFYQAMGATQIGTAPSVVFPERTLPLLQFKLV